jgi:NADPH:quinone reductase-like Zn-dependent oxidoreductase
VLIHGASGGVGAFAVQLAKHAGAYVFGTTSTRNIELVKSLGADQVIDYSRKDFAARLKDLDVVLDTVGGETQDRSWPVLRKGGVLVSLLAQPDAATAQRYGVTGKLVRGKCNREILTMLADLVDAGALKVILDRVFPLAEAGKAHELSAAGHTHGKIILEMV